jgi:hypothetical protein
MQVFYSTPIKCLAARDSGSYKFALNAISKMDGINVRRGQAQLLSGRAAIAALKSAGQ